MDTPFARAKREAMKADYNPEAFVNRIRELLEARKESAREASFASSLDHQALPRFLEGQRPNMIACILLADHFDVNPNEFLQLAAWPTIKAFDIHLESAANLPPEAVEVALDVARISEPGLRREVASAIRTLLKKYFV